MLKRCVRGLIWASVIQYLRHGKYQHLKEITGVENKLETLRKQAEEMNGAKNKSKRDKM